MIGIFIKIISLGRDYKLWMLLAVILGFFTVGSGIGLMMTSSYLIAKAAIQTPIYQLQVAIVGVRFFGISRGVFRYLERYISHEITFRLLAKFRAWFYKSLVPIVPSKTVDYTNGDLLTRSIEDIESLEHIFVRVVSPPFIFALTAVLMFSLLNIFSITYALIFVVTFSVSAFTIPTLTFLLSKKLGKKIILLRSQLKKITVDMLQGISELLIYGQSENWKKELLRIQEQLIITEYKMNLIQALHESLTGLAMNLTVAIMLFTAITDVTSGTLDGVYLAVITIGLMASFEIVFQIPIAFQYLSKSVEAGKRLFEITDQVPAIPETRSSGVLKLQNFNLKLQNVSFSYDGKKKVLQDISFDIKENEKIAIVGSSGAGKSTLVNILTRLWNYESGNISIGGETFEEFSPEEIRQLISVIPQRVHLFTGTIKENLLIANDRTTDEEMYSVLEMVDMKNMVKTLPDQLDTHIGEFGKKLSGGECKKLAIARAFLRNTPIIIFDEATSHVDNVTERQILETVNTAVRTKSIIFITHRMTQMEMFDNVLVFDRGKIIERGKHSELFAGGTYYKRLIQSQLHAIEII